MDRPVGRCCHARNRQAVVDYVMAVARNASGDRCGFENPMSFARRHTLRTELPIMKMVPLNEAVMPGAQPEVVAFADVAAVENQTAAHSETRPWRQRRPAAEMIVIPPAHPRRPPGSARDPAPAQMPMTKP